MKKEFNIEDPFEELIIRFLNGQLSVEETDELNRWIEESPENQEVFHSYQNIWLGSSVSLPDNKFNPCRSWNRVSHEMHKSAGRSIYKIKRKSRHIYVGLARIAALIIAVFTIGVLASYLIFAHYNSLSGEKFSEISVPKGSRSQIILPDSSVVWLNAGSRIIYPDDFNRNDRVVQLEGEAYFDVATNPRKPFVVKTPHLNVKAFGTVFNVKAYPDEDAVSATLVEGNVIVEIPDINDKPLSYNLEPRQNFTYNIAARSFESFEIIEQVEEEDEMLPEIGLEEKPDRPKATIYVRNNIRPELYTSWKDDVWVIEGETMADMAVMLGRRFNTRINIHNEDLERYRFTGKIRNETLEQVLDILRMTTPLKYSVGKGFVDWEIDTSLKEQYDLLLNRI